MTRRKVITEREVQRSARAGATSIDVSDAVVTPSARDAAVRAKIVLTGGSGVEASRARRPKPGGAESTGAARTSARPARPAVRSGPRGGSESRKPPAAPAPAPVTSAPAPSTPPPSASAKKPQSGITVALGADHGGVSMKTAIAERLRELGHGVLDFGTVTKDPVDYPDFAVAVAKAVAEGHAAMGVMIDGAGIGSCMAANKVRGVRAASCHDVTTAANAREHNNANVLTLGAGFIGPRLATVILDTFLATPFAGGRHKARVDKIDALDRPG